MASSLPNTSPVASRWDPGPLPWCKMKCRVYPCSVNVIPHNSLLPASSTYPPYALWMYWTFSRLLVFAMFLNSSWNIFPLPVIPVIWLTSNYGSGHVLEWKNLLGYGDSLCVCLPNKCERSLRSGTGSCAALSLPVLSDLKTLDVRIQHSDTRIDGRQTVCYL